MKITLIEQCLASVQLVPRATHLATSKELATRWNTGVDGLDRDLPGVQLSRIVNASFHSVNLVPCPAPVTVETFLLGWSVSTIFTLKRFRILELAIGCLVTLIATSLLVHLVSTLGMGILCVLWTCRLRLHFVSSLIARILLISPSFCCRPGWLVFPRMMGRQTDVRSLS